MTLVQQIEAIRRQMQLELNLLRASALRRNDNRALLFVQREQAYVDRHREIEKRFTW